MGKQTGYTDGKINNSVHVMEGRISGIEDTIQEID